MERDSSSEHPTSKGSQKSDEKQHTLRFALELKESSDKYFPEFSFRELLRSAVVGETKSKEKVWPEEDSEDEKLQALAKKFEEKYGPKPKSKKRRRERIEDLVDVTYGYDEMDPFVDNSEAYDELIPADWTTEHGGFYINQGGLNFRPISSDDSDDDFKGPKKKKTPKKMKDPTKHKKLKDTGEKEKKRKHLTPLDKKPKKVRLISGDKEKKHRKKLIMSSTPTTTSGTILSMLSTTTTTATPSTSTVTPVTVSPSSSSVSLTSFMSNGTGNVTPGTSTANSPQPPEKISVKTEGINEDSLPLSKPIAANALAVPEGASAVTSGSTTAAATSGSTTAAATSGSTTAAVTSGSTTAAVTSGSTPAAATSGSTPAAVTSGSTPAAATSGSTPAAATSGSTTAAVNQNGLPSSEGVGEDGNIANIMPKLPQYLPAQVEACVQKLQQASSNAADEGKCKFFNKDVNQLLLEIETKSRELSCRVRSGIYDYLAFYLPCTKETLLKRAKKLLLTDQAGRLREPMAKLKAAVDKVMPEQIKSFEEEVCQHVEEESKQNDTKLGVEVQNTEDKKKELFKSAMEVNEEGEKVEDATTPTDPSMASQTEEKIKKTVPKRKFVWTDELRELLHDVVTVKVKLFEMSKTRTTSAEEYLKEFFESEVRPLWPKGWMTSRILYRESKSIHSRVTSAPFRAKKVPGPKKQGEVSPSEHMDTSSPGVETTKVENTTAPVTMEKVLAASALLASTAISVQSKSSPVSSAAVVVTSGIKPAAASVTVVRTMTTAPTLASSIKLFPSVSSAAATKIALKITPVMVSKLPSNATTLPTMKLISNVTIPTAKLFSNIATVARLNTCSATTVTPSASVVVSKPTVMQRTFVQTVGVATKGENTVEKRPEQKVGSATVCLTEYKKTPSKAVGVLLQLPRTSGVVIPEHKQQTLPTVAKTEQQPKVVSVVCGTGSVPKRDVLTLSESIKTQPVTILDFADMVSADSQSDAQEMLGKALQGQSFINRTPSPTTQKPSEITVPYICRTSPSVVSPQHQQNIHYSVTSPSKLIRSSPQMVQAREHAPHPGVSLANRLMTGAMGTSVIANLQNNFIDLNASMMSQQRQQAAASKTILDAITSAPRMSMNMGGAHVTSVPLTHPVLTGQLVNPTQTVTGYHPANLQPPTLSMIGHANVQAKVTSPLSHMGMVPPTPLSGAMMHLTRPQQQQPQNNIVIPQNPYNQVLVGFNPSAAPCNPALQMTQASLLSNQNIFQDPNHNPTGGHPPSFMPRFS